MNSEAPVVESSNRFAALNSNEDSEEDDESLYNEMNATKVDVREHFSQTI